MNTNQEKIGHKAVLVYPRFYDETFWSMKRGFEKYLPRNKFGLPKVTLPPLGLMGLYAYLKPFYEEIVLIDRNIDPRPLDIIIKDADHVYMGGMISQQQGFLEDARTVKESKKILIAGGPIVSEDSPLVKIADHLVENEAEMVIDSLLKGLKNENAEKYYKGLYTPPDKFFQPDYSSIDLDSYMHMMIERSRGCPEDCEFCDIRTRFGKIVRIVPFEHTENAIRQLYDLGSRKTIFVADDNFLGNPGNAITFLEQLNKLEGELRYVFPKYTQVTMRLSDEKERAAEIRNLLRKTKFVTLFIGTETDNLESLVETGKVANIRESPLIDRLSLISKETGATIMQGIIYGFDHDTLKSADSLIEFINSTYSPVIMAGLLTAMPFTPLWIRLKQENRLREDSSGNNSDGRINFIPNNFSAKEAEKRYIEILEGIYSSRSYFSRVLRELKIVDAKPHSGSNLSNNDKIKTLIKILTKENALTYLRYLPKAHRIIKKRFGFMTQEYKNLLEEFITHCLQYTHFKGQVEFLKEQQSNRKYEHWQLLSFREIQKLGLDIKST